jgi:hypothetical protein
MESAEKRKSADMQTRPRRDEFKEKKRQNDHGIKPYASHSSFLKSGQLQACPSTEPVIGIIHDSYTDEKCMRNVTKKSPLAWT